MKEVTIVTNSKDVTNMKISNMVQVTDAIKIFGKNNVVLNQLNVTVPHNKIYALLGPSGCGKSVLLNCIVGLRSLDSGLVKLGITRRSELGYMPQDIGLSNEFTVEETFVFYGMMYGMNVDKAKEKMDQLSAVFGLLDRYTRIGIMSGGEQRRVSLAIALLHEPKLLILDEPTVGVDPVLSRKIWQFLQLISGNGVTVIITTHYVEEARKSHVVGLMREGELLFEDSPEKLMLSQNADSLENAFIKLSEIHRRQRRKLEVPLDKQILASAPFETESLINASRLSAQLNKNFIHLRRNTTLFILLALLPFLLTFLFCEAFGFIPTYMKLAVVSEELETDEYCGDRPSSNFITAGLNCTVPAPFSCFLLQKLKLSTRPVIYHSDEEAKAALLSNEARGMMHIPFNFTTALSKLLLNNINMWDDAEVLDLALNQVTIDTHLDSSDYVANQWLRKILTDRYQNFVTGIVASCGLPESYAESPLRFMDPIYGKKEPTLAESTLPGHITSLGFYFTVLFTTGAIMKEKSAGLVDRNKVAGMTHLEMLTAHSVVQLCLVTVQNAIMFVVFYVIYKQTLLGSPTLVFFLLYAIEMIGVGFGFFITELFDSERNITYAAIGTILSSLVVAGPLWPLEGTHWLFRKSMWAFPLNPASRSYQSIAMRGLGMSNPGVAKGFISSVTWSTIFFLAAILLHKCKQQQSSGVLKRRIFWFFK